MPSLSQSGRWVLVGGAGLALGGVLGGIAPVALAGSATLSALALAWVAALPLSRAMRRERLEFSWWLAPRAGGPRHPDEPVMVKVALRNPTGSEVVLSTPRLALSPGVRYARRQGQRVVVPPQSAAVIDLEVRPSHAGRHVLHGAWMTLEGPLGLSWVALYFPNPLVVEVQPRGFSPIGGQRPRAVPAPTMLRAGRATRRAGEGPELRELREHQPGDPFRRIAWKASARRGRLVVRETEDESQTTRVAVIDASATMRGDDRGRSRLDYAVELVAQAARWTSSSGDRLGLVAFAHDRVVCSVAPDDGGHHARAVVSAAVELRGLVDEDVTDLDDDALVETVARYFREQEGVDVTHGAPGYELRHRILRLIERATAGDPSMRSPVRAREHTARVMRAFCRARCIPLPLHHDPHGPAKGVGLAAAIRAAVQGARETRTVLVISDLDGVNGALDEVRRALGLARQKRHRVTVVAPAGPDFIPAAPKDLAGDDLEARRAVEALFLAEEQLRYEDLRRSLALAGVPLYTAKASDPVARWFRRAAAPRV